MSETVAVPRPYAGSVQDKREQRTLARRALADVRLWLHDPRFAAPVGLALRVWVAFQLLRGTVPRLLGHARHEWMGGQNIRDWLGPLVKQHVYYSAPVGSFLRFVLHHSVGFAWLLFAAELAVGLGVISGTLLRAASFGGVALMTLYAIAGFSGVNGEFLGAFLAIFLLCPEAGILGGDGLIALLRRRRPSMAPVTSSR